MCIMFTGAMSLMSYKVRNGVERMRCLIPRCLKGTHSGRLLCQPFLPCLFWLSQVHQVTKPPFTTRIRTWLVQSEPGPPLALTCLFSPFLALAVVQGLLLLKPQGSSEASQLLASAEPTPAPPSVCPSPSPTRQELPAGQRGGTGGGGQFPMVPGCRQTGSPVVLCQASHR